MDRRLTIGQLAESSGIPPKTIRYYEEIGILPTPERNKVGYRIYSETDLRRLDLVRRARTLDMALPEVRELVEWATSGTCNDFQDRFVEVVRQKLEEVDRRLTDLERLKQDLRHLEAHFMTAGREVATDHTVLECSPEKCTCLGNVRNTNSRNRR